MTAPKAHCIAKAWRNHVGIVQCGRLDGYGLEGHFCKQHAKEGRTSPERRCTDCGAEFDLPGVQSRCKACRAKVNKAWRDARDAEGRPVKGMRYPREYYRDYDRIYLSDPEKRKRRKERQRQYKIDPETRPKYLARARLQRAVKDGRVRRTPCEMCGDPNTHGHHDDYSKPLDVRWLCRTHHAEVHRLLGRDEDAYRVKYRIADQCPAPSPHRTRKYRRSEDQSHVE